MNTTARKLTLDEIKAFPKASVIWYTYATQTDDGVIWHCCDPALIVWPGENGHIVGGDLNSIFSRVINDQLMKDGTTFWSAEPPRDQLLGITRKEYDEMEDFEGKIAFPKLVTEITIRGYTFKQFCDLAGIRYSNFKKAITGECEFVAQEIGQIGSALHLTDDEIRTIFFNEFCNMV